MMIKITTILLIILFANYGFSQENNNTPQVNQAQPAQAVQNPQTQANQAAQTLEAPKFGSSQLCFKFNLPLGDKGGVDIRPLPNSPQKTTEESFGFLSLMFAYTPRKSPGLNMGFQVELSYVNGKNLSHITSSGGTDYTFDIKAKYIRFEAFYIAHWMFNFGLEIGGGIGLAFTMNQTIVDYRINLIPSKVTQWSPGFSVPVILISLRMNLIRWLAFGIQFKIYAARIEKKIENTEPLLYLKATPPFTLEFFIGAQL